MHIVRESQPNHAHGQWILSTNRPYRFLGSLWLLVAVLLTVDGILFYGVYLWFPASFFGLTPGALVFLLPGWGIYYFAGGAFLHHDSRTIHKDPFPEGSPCNSHPNQMAYDWCAICGALKCAPDLVRIRQSRRLSPGMFGFDGVACQRCAQRRVKRFLAIATGLQLASLPLVVGIAAAAMMFLPSQLAAIFLVIVGAIYFTLLPLAFWYWRKGWRTVTTPLSEQPLLMTPTAERLVEKGVVGDRTAFKRVASLSA